MDLAVLSNERLQPWINWSTLGPPLLEPLAASGGTLIAPPPLRWAHLRDWTHCVRQIWAADTVFWMQGSARAEPPILALSALRGPVRRSAFVVDAWMPALGKIRFAAAAQRLDPCFVAFRQGYEQLERTSGGRRFEWLPFGVDTEVFRAHAGERDIFAFWMGRRHEPMHQALLSYCQSRGLSYRYRVPGEFHSPRELGNLAGRSRYFVVTPPDLDDPVRTGGYSPLVMRYLEGLAAGARLLGVLPTSGEYQDLLPTRAILQVKADGSDLAGLLDADAEDAEGWAAVQRAERLVHERHSWTRRAEQIHQRLTNGTPIQLDLR